MVLALVKKEMRENWLFAALAVGMYGLYLYQLTRRSTLLPNNLFWWIPGMNVERPEVPFVEGNFATMLFFIGAALALALGFRQSAWEPSQGTSLYLFHLPLTRRMIFVTKFLAGIGLLLLCTLLPILIYGLWAASPGTHPSPFEWSMTVPAFQVWLLMPIFYLGAFASGIRPARWFGSRLLPLLSAGLMATLLALLAQWWLIAFPLLLLLYGVFISDIFLEAERRDY
jgi:hypothetical protein